MKLVRKLALALILIIATGLFIKRSSTVMAKYEEPHYDVLFKENNFEIRQYDTTIVAKVRVKASRKEALNKGFRILAAYIFGNNTGTKVAMTAPVTQTRANHKSNIISEKIAMTAPVTSKAEGAEWEVSFTMPSKYTLDTLPAPKDKSIKIEAVEGKKFAAIKFSGSWSANNFERRAGELEEFLRARNYRQSGEPIDAYYNPPFMPPFWRRNEVLISIDDI